LFARLLVQDADVILLDEPFAAIDERTSGDLLQLLQRWSREGRTVVAVLHDLEQVRLHFSRTLLLARRTIDWGDTRTVLTPRIWRGRAQCSRVKPGRRAAGRHERPAVDHKHWSLHELWLHAPSLGCLRRTRGRPGADWHPIASAPPLMMKLSVNSEDESSGSCVLSKQENTIISKPKSPTECSSLQID